MNWFTVYKRILDVLIGIFFRMTHNSWVMETFNHQTEKHKNEWIERVVYISFKPAKELVDDYRILPWNLIKFMILNFANWFRIIKLVQIGVILISDPLPLARKDWVRMKLDDPKLQTMSTLSVLLGRSLSDFWPSAFCFRHFPFFSSTFRRTVPLSSRIVYLRFGLKY